LWYDDDAGAGEKFSGIKRYFLKLQEKGPRRGYFPEPSKSILVVQEHNLDKAKREFSNFGFQIVTGMRYLGGFIGEADLQNI
jgi:hypothetical protein